MVASSPGRSPPGGRRHEHLPPGLRPLPGPGALRRDFEPVPARPLRRLRGASLLRMEVRRAVMEQLGGLDLSRPRPITHHPVDDLPPNLPVLVQANADPIDVPWIATAGMPSKSRSSVRACNGTGGGRHGC